MTSFKPLQFRGYLNYSHDYRLKVYRYVFCMDLAQIAITVLSSVKFSAFATETECAYCAVRAEYLFGFCNRDGVFTAR